MNVTELARKLKTPTNELLEILPELGFDIGAKAIKIDDSLIDKIITAHNNYKKKEKMRAEDEEIQEIKIEDQDKKEISPDKILEIGNEIIVRDMAEKMKFPINKVMAELMKNGIMVSLNSSIDFETATIIAEDLGFEVKKISSEKKEKEIEEEKMEKLKNLLSQNKNLKTKPPVVVVMGHVDHGKTKLLDTIRKTNVIDTEAGNITQHIGAYQVECSGKLITFLDTPGHEAFKAMRSRGTKIADVGIIVIAADEGLKPQTIESIELLQKEKLPFLIAINKIDKDEADIEKIKKELSELNLTPEDWGGKTICVEISAKQNINIDGLLEMVNLMADLENLQADAGRQAIGTIIESHVDKNQGPVASVLIQTGTLKLQDEFSAGHTFGKVKAMINYAGQNIKEAPPSTPVRILGFKDAPAVGDIFSAEISAQELKTIKKNKSKRPINKQQKTNSQKSDEEEKIKSLNIILKTDVIGSQGAIEESLAKIIREDLKIKIIKKGLGSITDKDVLDAEATKALLIGFHVQIDPNAEMLSKEKSIEIKNYQIIYKLLEDVEEKINKMSSEKIIRKQTGELKVLAIFKTLKNKSILGGKVIKGQIEKGNIAKIIRAKECIARGKINNLQSGKENVQEVVTGQECGIEFEGETIIEPGDVLEAYKEIKKQ